jgi:hypothetical protein
MRKRGRLDSAFEARLDAWQGRAGAAQHLKHVLLLAGPYGSGKTMLAAQIAAGVLPPDIAAILPAGADRWVETSGRKMFAAGAGDEARSADGLLLHYNLLRPPIHRIASYAADPLLRVLDLAAPATVLTLCLPLPRLLAQFVERSLQEQDTSSLRSRLRRGTVGRLVRRPPANALAVKPEPPGVERLVGRYRRVYGLYQQPGWLDDWYRRWEEFLASKTAAGRSLHTHWVEPLAGQKSPSFRLVPPPSTSNARSHSGGRKPP